MQDRLFLVILVCVASVTEGFLFSSKPKCQIKKYKSSKYIAGDPLLIHEDFHDRVKPLEAIAKSCRVHVYVKGSYYQLANPAQQVLVTDADIVIGHGLQFEIRDEQDAIFCNKVCLAKNPMDIPEVKCVLQGAMNLGLIWSRSNSDVLSDGTYAANTAGYQTLKIDVQTRCKDEKLKRNLLHALRTIYAEDSDSDEDKKKK